jgi:hypothetical protein
VSRPFRELERIETRVLGALRLVDASTGVDIDTPLVLRALDGHARFVRNPSGLHVIAFWSTLAAHEAAFVTPPNEPDVGAFELPISITDPAGRYLPRRVTVALPCEPDPDNADDEGSLFRPVLTPMYPAAAAATGPNWSVVRVSVTDQASGDALGGAFLNARRNGDVLGRGLTDGRGEGLLALPGIPMLTFGDDDEAVVVEEITVTVGAVFDPDQGTRIGAAALRAGARPPVPVVDPDALEALADDLVVGARELAVAARRSQTVSLALDLP